MRRLFLRIFLVAVTIEMRTRQQQTIVEFDSYRDCENSGNLKITTRNVSIRFDRSRRRQLVDLNVDVKQNLKAELSMVLTVVRCKVKEAPDTCVHFTKLKTKKVCDVLHANSYGLTKFVACMHPMVPCPPLKGTYRARNCSFNMENFNVFPIIGSYWTVTGELFQGKEMVACSVSKANVYSKQ